MYELTFGITDAPFRLTPDPAFYFDGEGHSVALAELRSGLSQVGGLVVLTGEIGVGKTTIVRTLMSELAADGLLVGEIVSTQLDAEELLVAVANAFGVAPQGATADATVRSLTDFLNRRGADGKRVVAFIDEAQNLQLDALLPIVALASRTQKFPLQLCLVGQPELRTLVAAAPLRDRIYRSFHLSALGPSEVRAYVEHRLRTVQWNGTPSFDDEAFAEIFRWTEGVPRRINLLCTRLLLSRFLDISSHVSVATVIESAQELLAEIGNPELASADVVDLMTSTRTHSEGETPLPDAPPPSSPRSVERRVAEIAKLDRSELPVAPRPILCLVAGDADFPDAAALIKTMVRRPSGGPVLMVRVFRVGKERFSLAAVLESGLPLRTLDLDLGSSPARVHGGELRKRFIAVCEEERPGAVVVFQNTDASLVCAIAARQRRIPVISVGPAARERREQQLRDELAKKIWRALHEASDLRP